MDDWQETWHHVHDVLGHKWAFHVLRALRDGDHGFNELKHVLGVRSKPLSERLSELRCVGLVERDVTATTPPSTSYRLTEDGEDLVAALARVEDVVSVEPCECDCDCETLTTNAAAPCEC